MYRTQFCGSSEKPHCDPFPGLAQILKCADECRWLKIHLDIYCFLVFKEQGKGERYLICHSARSGVRPQLWVSSKLFFFYSLCFAKPRICLVQQIFFLSEGLQQHDAINWKLQGWGSTHEGRFHIQSGLPTHCPSAGIANRSPGTARRLVFACLLLQGEILTVAKGIPVAIAKRPFPSPECNRLFGESRRLPDGKFQERGRHPACCAGFGRSRNVLCWSREQGRQACPGCTPSRS